MPSDDFFFFFENVQTGRRVVVDIAEVSRLLPRAYMLSIQQLQGWKNYSILDSVARSQKQKPGVMI